MKQTTKRFYNKPYILWKEQISEKVYNALYEYEEKLEALEYEVVSSIDDEGNGFNRVGYAPSLGHYNSDDKEFVAEDQFEEY